MRRYVLVVLWGLWPLVLMARDPAHVTLYCNSLRFSAGMSGPGLGTTLELTTDSNLNEINGEVGPLYNPNLPTHGAFFRLEDPALGDAITGRIAFDKPTPVDANGNGFDDFFESSQGVASTTTQGLFTTPVDNGSVQVIWSRDPGSATGTCQLQLTATMFGALGVFTHQFDLLEYTGLLNYLPATNSITGTIGLAQTGTPSNTLTGVVTFVRVATNRFDELTLAPGKLTNAAALTLTYPAADLLRDDSAKTNYYGFLDFDDGDPSTATIDYVDWVLSIDDSNDANGNGIPDLSDDPVGVPAAAPTLTLVRAATDLLLSIHKGNGSVYQLEQAASLRPTNWTATASVTVTNDPQVIHLPFPTTATRFWRLRGP